MTQPGAHARISPLRSRAASGLAAVLLCAAVAILAVPAAGARAGHRRHARAARSIYLRENGHLHLTSKRGFTLNEEGNASGTIHGKIYIHLHVVSVKRVTAEVNIYPRGGSISGHATASYRVAGPTAHFSGRMSVSRGTGSFRHAHASGLSFSGTIRRSDDAVTVHLSGRMAE